MNDFICVPLQICWESSLTAGEKLFLGFLITNAKDNHCIGTNKYFAEHLCLNVLTISKYIEKLELLNFIDILFSEEQGVIIRHIYPHKP